MFIVVSHSAGSRRQVSGTLSSLDLHKNSFGISCDCPESWRPSENCSKGPVPRHATAGHNWDTWWGRPPQGLDVGLGGSWTGQCGPLETPASGKEAESAPSIHDFRVGSPSRVVNRAYHLVQDLWLIKSTFNGSFYLTVPNAILSFLSVLTSSHFLCPRSQGWLLCHSLWFPVTKIFVFIKTANFIPNSPGQSYPRGSSPAYIDLAKHWSLTYVLCLFLNPSWYNS